MNIYKVTNYKRIGYDTYDSMIVYANNEESARLIHPSEFVTHYKENMWYGTREFLPKDDPRREYETDNDSCLTWVLFEDRDKLEVELIGQSQDATEEGVILASFNAG